MKKKNSNDLSFQSGIKREYLTKLDKLTDYMERWFVVEDYKKLPLYNHLRKILLE